eukprot:scaffold215904_cov17-Tisochrysis_lutea.AAC.2
MREMGQVGAVSWMAWTHVSKCSFNPFATLQLWSRWGRRGRQCQKRMSSKHVPVSTQGHAFVCMSWECMFISSCQDEGGGAGLKQSSRRCAQDEGGGAAFGTLATVL